MNTFAQILHFVCGIQAVSILENVSCQTLIFFLSVGHYITLTSELLKEFLFVRSCTPHKKSICARANIYFSSCPHYNWKVSHSAVKNHQNVSKCILGINERTHIRAITCARQRTFSTPINVNSPRLS